MHIPTCGGVTMTHFTVALSIDILVYHCSVLASVWSKHISAVVAYCLYSYKRQIRPWHVSYAQIVKPPYHQPCNTWPPALQQHVAASFATPGRQPCSTWPPRLQHMAASLAARGRQASVSHQRLCASHTPPPGCTTALKSDVSTMAQLCTLSKLAVAPLSATHSFWRPVRCCTITAGIAFTDLITPPTQLY